MSSSIPYNLLSAPMTQAPGANLQKSQIDIRTFSDVEWDFGAGDVVTPKRIIRGVAVIVQWANFAVTLPLGGWHLDTTKGIPLRQRVFGQNRDLRAVRDVYMQALLKVPGIVRVDNLQVTLNNETRRVRVHDFVGWLSSGERLEIPEFAST